VIAAARENENRRVISRMAELGGSALRERRKGFVDDLLETPACSRTAARRSVRHTRCLEAR
jgi:hypothetical protein